MKKRVFIPLLLLCVMLLCPGCLMAMDLPMTIRYQRDEITDLSDVRFQSLWNGKLVEGDVQYVMDVCAEEKTSVFGFRLSDEPDTLYYLLWLQDSYLVLETKDQFDALDQLCDDTWTYLQTDPDTAVKPENTVHIQGEAVEMPDKIREYAAAWLTDAGFSDKNITDNLEPYMLRSLDYRDIQTKVYVGIAMAVVGLGGLIVLLVMKRRMG